LLEPDRLTPMLVRWAVPVAGLMMRMSVTEYGDVYSLPSGPAAMPGHLPEPDRSSPNVSSLAVAILPHPLLQQPLASLNPMLNVSHFPRLARRGEDHLYMHTERGRVVSIRQLDRIQPLHRIAVAIVQSILDIHLVIILIRR